MRIRIVFTLRNKGGTVPFHHQSLLSSFIKTQVANSPHQDFTFYNFSGLKGQTKVSRLGLHFYSSKVTLVVSSLQKSWIDGLLKAVFSHSQIELGNLLLVPDFAELEEQPEFAPQMKYVCISPIAVIGEDTETHTAKKFISPEEDLFSDLLYDMLMKRMEQSGLYSAEQLADFYKFQVVPDKQYLQKIQEGDKKFARIYTLMVNPFKYEFRAYTLPFALYADEVVQKFVFECGLGYHTAEGFGMIDPIGEAGKISSVYNWQKI